MEKQANRCAYGLMLPATSCGGSWRKSVERSYLCHEGEKYEQIGLAIAEEYHIPHFRLRARMIQLGPYSRQGRAELCGQGKDPAYSFDEESLRQSEHTFNIDRVTAGCLSRRTRLQKTAGQREIHLCGWAYCAHEPRFVDQALWGTYADAVGEQACGSMLPSLHKDL